MAGGLASTMGRQYGHQSKNLMQKQEKSETLRDEEEVTLMLPGNEDQGGVCCLLLSGGPLEMLN